MNTTLNLGPKLTNTRESMRLSIKEAADRLRINPKFLTMLEEENFAQALPFTFMRGYLRSYTRLLNFTENEINLAVSQLSHLMPQMTHEKITPALSLPKSVKKDRWHHLSTYLIIFTMLLLVGIWWKSHRMNFNFTNPTIVQPVLEHPAAIAPKDEHKIVESSQPSIKIAKNTTPMKMAVPEEPGLDLTEEE